MFGINKYALIAIIVIAITVILTVILVIHAIKYNIKQKNLTIRECLKNNISYKENIKIYNEKLEEIGITSKKEKKKFLKLLETLRK